MRRPYYTYTYLHIHIIILRVVHISKTFRKKSCWVIYIINALKWAACGNLWKIDPEIQQVEQKCLLKMLLLMFDASFWQLHILYYDTISTHILYFHSSLTFHQTRGGFPKRVKIVHGYFTSCKKHFHPATCNHFLYRK